MKVAFLPCPSCGRVGLWCRCPVHPRIDHCVTGSSETHRDPQTLEATTEEHAHPSDHVEGSR